jgi:hypothetical protein
MPFVTPIARQASANDTLPFHNSARGMAGCAARAAMRDDQTSALIRARLLLMRIAPEHDESRAIATLLKEPHVGIDLEPIRHLAIKIGEHAVSRDDGVTFNANVLRHVPFCSSRSSMWNTLCGVGSALRQPVVSLTRRAAR